MIVTLRSIVSLEVFFATIGRALTGAGIVAPVDGSFASAGRAVEVAGAGVAV